MKKFFAIILALGVVASFAFQSQNTVNADEITADTVTADSMPADVHRKMEDLGKDMEKIGKEMEKQGKKMEEFAKKMEKNPGNIDAYQADMEKVSAQMESLGKEMEKRGKVMEKYGKELERRHKIMYNWLFNELKKDGLTASATGKISFMMENGLLVVNGKQASSEMLQKYRKGMEERLGTTFKDDFSIYMKGDVKADDDGQLEFSGNMNTHY